MLHVTNLKIRIYSLQPSRRKSCKQRHEIVDLDRYTTVTWRKCLVDVFLWIIFLCIYRSKSAKIFGILSEYPDLNKFQPFEGQTAVTSIMPLQRLKFKQRKYYST